MTDVSRRFFDDIANITGEVFKCIERDVYSAMAQKEKENQARDGQQHRGSDFEAELPHKLARLKDKHASILRQIADF